MLPDKSILLEQITTAINNNSCKNGCEEGEFTRGKVIDVSHALSDQHYFSVTRNQESFKKLEQRIDALEEQNDRLLYFIHFLYKNFPDLVKDIIPGDMQVNSYAAITGQTSMVTETQAPSVTRREIEVLQLLVKGLCAKEIANMLFISESTVITHKKNLKEKFNARNTVELISKALTTIHKK
ncbi:MAG: helix-turn-helix transcriptional regulator [Chitinophagaceae bacterium]